jgi:ketose-bisphosphate aldolase
MLTPFKDLLAHALRHHYAIGYYEAWDIYSLEAVLETAEEAHQPVILGFGGAMMNPEWMDDGAIERLGGLGVATANAAHIPVCLLLNEVKTFTQVVRGIHAGFNAVMLDTSDLPFAENVALTCKVVEVAHAVNVGVEAELGILPDASAGPEHKSQLTNPQQAARFVQETGVDALSVSIGNVHILSSGEASINLGVLAAIHESVNIPLVIHGGTGFPETVIPQVIPLGVAKVNIGTVLKQVYLNGIKEAVTQLPDNASIQDVMGSRKQTDILQYGKAAMRREIARRMKLWNSSFSIEGK